MTRARLMVGQNVAVTWQTSAPLRPPPRVPFPSSRRLRNGSCTILPKIDKPSGKFPFLREIYAQLACLVKAEQCNYQKP
jgi:hypothetical protein